jgi:hypothetical protein
MSGQNYGVQGQTASSSGTGVFGKAIATSGTTYGVVGQSLSGDTSGIGVYGTSTGGSGVVGIAGSTNVDCCTNAVFGQNVATSGHNNGGELTTSSPAGVGGIFENTGGGLSILARVNANQNSFSVDGGGNGLFYGGLTVNGNGTFGPTQVNGNLNVTGTLTKGGGSFKIDDPLDPANKYLSHSFVESPDMMNIYNGNVTTDKRGLATVILPNYFEALNRDFRYQLTVIGQFAQAIVAKEIDRGRFTIKTNKPGVKVSWQVTGIRQDAWANAHRIPNEEDKPEDKRGTYLYPELYESTNTNTNAMLHP